MNSEGIGGDEAGVGEGNIMKLFALTVAIEVRNRILKYLSC